MRNAQEHSSPPELTPEGSRAIQDIVAEHAAADTTSWESIAAAICVVLQFFFMPPAIASRVPSAVLFPIELSAINIALGTFAAGFGFAALRQAGRKGRIVGAISFVIGMSVVFNWVVFTVGILFGR